MVVRELLVKGILSKSKVFDYVVNPYIGCQHGCTYCYARFMKRFTGHTEPWGEFVDVKINAPELLKHQITRASPGRVWVSGVSDPYQPLEKQYMLTRKCLDILLAHGWEVTVQTKSPLVLRDVELLQEAPRLEVGLTITTTDEAIRQLFEPKAPSIEARLHALEELHNAGIRTFAMIAPLLPGAEGLAAKLDDKVDYVLIDRMNYHYGDRVYRKYGLASAFSDAFFFSAARQLASAFAKRDIECQILF
jgi:DNA repair photolyase